MDPEAVIAEARGDVDESLLTRTGGGFLGREVLSDAPLVEHLHDEETLHYLLAAPAAPARVENGTAEQLETQGSYRTLLAVTDTRLLLVAGSGDGDRSFEFPYADLLDVRHEPGLLTDTVRIEDHPSLAWEVAVGSGSNASAAASYARDRITSADVEPTARSELVETVFDGLVEPNPATGVEQYESEGLDALVSDLEGHHERLLDHVENDERDAARTAGATVDALAAEGERLAEARDRPEIRRRVAATRREARRTVVATEFEVGDPTDLTGSFAPALKELLQAVDALAFERFVADLWSELGYQTTVTQSSKDRGVDVVARQSTPVVQTVIIQAKRYGPGTRVGREEVQQYASLHRQEPDADLVVVVTTGAFTAPAQEAATNLNVKLVDGDRLVEIVAERELYALVARYVGD